MNGYCEFARGGLLPGGDDVRAHNTKFNSLCAPQKIFSAESRAKTQIIAYYDDVEGGIKRELVSIMGRAQSECARRRRNKQEKLISTRVEEVMGRKKIS